MAPPSIPSRFRILHVNNSETNAFNTSQRRFDAGEKNDLPGPAYYTAPSTLSKQSSSSSKAGFDSTARRFGLPPVPNDIGPGTYSNHTTYTLHHHHHVNPTPAFQTPLASPPPPPSLSHSDSHPSKPGPADYDVPRAFASLAPSQSGAQGAFLSRTSRTLIDPSQLSTPPPGHYFLPMSLPVHPISAPFRSTSKRTRFETSTGPGPNAYHRDTDDHDGRRQSTRPRLCPVPKHHPIGLHSVPVPNSQRSGEDEYRHSGNGGKKKEHGTTATAEGVVPAPGAYDTLDTLGTRPVFNLRNALSMSQSQKRATGELATTIAEKRVLVMRHREKLMRKSHVQTAKVGFGTGSER